MEYYGNNDWRDYHLAHFGVKGMKWGKHLKAASDWWNYDVTGQEWKKSRRHNLNEARKASENLKELVGWRAQSRTQADHKANPKPYEDWYERAMRQERNQISNKVWEADLDDRKYRQSLFGRGEKALKKAGSAVNAARKSAGKAISSGAKKLSKAASGALNRLVKGASKAKNKIFNKKPSSYSKRVQKANNDFIRSTDYYFKAKDAAKKGKLSKTKHYRLKSNTTRDSMWKGRMKIKKKHW